MRFKTLLGCVFVLLPAFAGSAARVRQQTAPDASTESKPQPSKAEALESAHQLLGNYAEIVRYGELNRPGLTEAIAVVKIGAGSGSSALHITDLAILQFRDGDWKVALSTDKYGAKNNSGYVGVEFLNDAITKASFRLKILEGGTARSRLRLMLTSTAKYGRADKGAVPVVIAWNAKVGRYEALDDHGVKFMPEVANPPNLKSEKGK
jgi:hypothetical protein